VGLLALCHLNDDGRLITNDIYQKLGLTVELAAEQPMPEQLIQHALPVKLPLQYK
jgi:hypothetical protein